jgi:hypothetical protein
VNTFNLSNGTTLVTWVAGDLFPLYGLSQSGASVTIAGTAVTVLGPSGSPYIQNTQTSLFLQGQPFGGPLAGATMGASVATSAYTGAFLDTFFVINPADSSQFYISAPLDGTSWDAGDTATKEGYPDHIGRILADHEELYLFGESRTEVWHAPGADATFPWQRDDSASIHMGIAAPFSAVSALGGVAWIGGDDRGQPVAYFAQGSQPQRISTHAIEQVWASYGGINDAVGFVYELDGHVFWQIGFGIGDATWVYDFTASQQFGKPMWHERDSWDGSAFHRHRAAHHAYAFGQHYAGDFANGNIYKLDSTIYQDNGQTITRQRVCPHISADRLRQFFQKFQLDMETAVGGVALTVVLEWSDDGGHSFQGAGANFTFTTSTTNTLDRITAWQLGSAEDRVFRVTITGNSRTSITDCYLEWITGIS